MVAMQIYKGSNPVPLLSTKKKGLEFSLKKMESEQNILDIRKVNILIDYATQRRQIVHTSHRKRLEVKSRGGGENEKEEKLRS